MSCSIELLVEHLAIFVFSMPLTSYTSIIQFSYLCSNIIYINKNKNLSIFEKYFTFFGDWCTIEWKGGGEFIPHPKGCEFSSPWLYKICIIEPKDTLKNEQYRQNNDALAHWPIFKRERANNRIISEVLWFHLKRAIQVLGSWCHQEDNWRKQGRDNLRTWGIWVHAEVRQVIRIQIWTRELQFPSQGWHNLHLCQVLCLMCFLIAYNSCIVLSSLGR